MQPKIRLDEVLPLRKRLETYTVVSKSISPEAVKKKKNQKEMEQQPALSPQNSRGHRDPALLSLLQLCAPSGTAGNKDSLKEPRFNWTQAQRMGTLEKRCRQSGEPKVEQSWE